MPITLRLPSFFRREPRPRIPETRPIARTGDARYVPQIARWERQKSGRVICQANRFDQISILDYDRVRFYPVIRDGLRMLRLATRRTNFHFTCSRQDIADLAQKELGPKIPKLIETLMRGSMEFGWQAVAVRWKPAFERSVSTGQQSAGSDLERFFPFVWTIDRFHSFSPQDTRILIDSNTGDFAGIRQYTNYGRNPNILKRDCIHFVNDQEFDGNYGVPLTKSAVPFVEAAESIMDDMSLYSNIFGSPWKVLKYPQGRMGGGLDEGGNPIYEENSAVATSLLEGIESAHNIALPSGGDDKGNPKWDLTIVQPPAEDRYVPKIQFLNDMIRMAIAFPQMASSSSPETGTYNLGQVQIDLFLANIQAYTDALFEVINEQLVLPFVNHNFGPSAPDCRAVAEPIDFSAKTALLQALVQFLSTGQPLQEMGGKYIYPDWAKMAEDLGVPVLSMDPRRAAQDILNSVRDRLRQMGQPANPPQEPQDNGEPDPD